MMAQCEETKVNAELKVEESLETLNNGRFIKVNKIAGTLQGDLCQYYDSWTKRMVVIKKTDKLLHINKRGLKNEKVDEDIIKEAKILQWISHSNDCNDSNDSNKNKMEIPLGFVRYIDFFQDNRNYYLVQEYGGSDLFNYVVSQNEEINKGNLTINDWNLRVRYLIRQIAESLYYFHYYKHLCHLDMSLENTLIGLLTNDKTGEIFGVMPRIIDFGLSETFLIESENSDLSMSSMKCNKFVGKKVYKAPEVWYLQAFNPFKADVWSFGVMIFMMILGNPPYIAPDMRYCEFQYIYNGKMEQLIKCWNKWNRMPPLAFDLLQHMLCPESKRYNMQQVLNHPFIKNCPSFDDIKNKWGNSK